MWNWENNRSEPQVRLWPAILAILGYDPCITPKTTVQQHTAAREAKGEALVQIADNKISKIKFPKYNFFIPQFL